MDIGFARQLIPSAVLFGFVTISNSVNNAKTMSGKLYMSSSVLLLPSPILKLWLLCYPYLFYIYIYIVFFYLFYLIVSAVSFWRLHIPDQERKGCKHSVSDAEETRHSSQSPGTGPEKSAAGWSYIWDEFSCSTWRKFKYCLTLLYVLKILRMYSVEQVKGREFTLLKGGNLKKMKYCFLYQCSIKKDLWSCLTFTASEV